VGPDRLIRGTRLIAGIALMLSAAGCGGSGDLTLVVEESAVVGRRTDGDTFRLRDGRIVRLLQIDAPEHDECYGRASGAALARLAPRGTRIVLSSDARLDELDEHGRLLRYVHAVDGDAPVEPPVNVALVRSGAAVPYFFRGDRGRYAAELLDAAEDARRNRRGLWGACPGARLDPNRGSLTGPA
jgi:endonuclease YncB( thermonuclease family)